MIDSQLLHILVLHILVVDDHPEEQELVLLALQRVGLRSKVHCVNSRNEAVVPSPSRSNDRDVGLLRRG